MAGSIRVGLRHFSRILRPPILHPLACFFNSCENCAEWTPDSNWIAACSLDSIDYMEGVGSLRWLEASTVNWAAHTYAYLTTIDICDMWCGFWWKSVFPNDVSMAMAGMFTSDLVYYAIIQAVRFDGVVPGNVNMRCFVNHPVSGIHAGPWAGLTQDTWYWVEIESGTYYTNVYRNGVAIDGLATAQPWPTWAYFALWHHLGYRWGDHNIDYVRFAATEEYPPT